VSTRLEKLQEDFNKLRDPIEGKKRILQKNTDFKYELGLLKILSNQNSDTYPAQGMLQTPFDGLDVIGFKTLNQQKIIKTLKQRAFFLEMFNHPYRMHFLNEINSKDFVAPPKISSLALDDALSKGFALAIGDLGATTHGALKERIRRTHRYAQGPFIKLGRQARSLFVGSANPEVWGTPMAVATMAASHCICAIARNGLFTDINRQVDFAKETFEILDNMSETILKARRDKAKITKFWKNNVMGVIEPSEKSIHRARALYKAGVRFYRIYSPEPGIGPVNTVKMLRAEFGQKVEIMSGHLVDVKQMQAAQKAGADIITIGIGGGGRCITGVRSGTAIDWPELLWKSRGLIKIPIIVEGGASDHVATSLLLGASGIGITRVGGGGTIESPGGYLYCVGEDGQFFKPYGGEASARAKYIEGKLLPFNVPSFVEGETTKAFMKYDRSATPSIAYNLHVLTEDAILALVFRGVRNVYELQSINPSPLKLISVMGRDQAVTH
jgi:hypothetical protein